MPNDTYSARLKPGYVVYQISDPRDGALFYIGVTNNLARRVTQHFACVPGKPTAKRIRAILDADRLPEFCVITRMPSYDDARAHELRLIAERILEGHQLENAGFEIADALRAYAETARAAE